MLLLWRKVGQSLLFQDVDGNTFATVKVIKFGRDKFGEPDIQIGIKADDSIIIVREELLNPSRG